MSAGLTAMRGGYETRIILFVDFLGFREFVEASVQDASLLASFRASLPSLTYGFDDPADPDWQMSQFSDSLVVSARVDGMSNVFWLISMLASTLVSMVEHGFLVRGAMTCGLLQHDDVVLIGPAMVEAYRLESQVAVHPRVIIAPDLLDIAEQHRKPGHTAEQERGYVEKYLGIDPTDGLHYVDYLSYDAVCHAIGCEEAGYPGYMLQLADLIQDGLAHADARVGDKYEWLAARYEEAVSDLLARIDPTTSPDPDWCRAIAALPRFPGHG